MPASPISSQHTTHRRLRCVSATQSLVPLYLGCESGQIFAISDSVVIVSFRKDKLVHINLKRFTVLPSSEWEENCVIEILCGYRTFTSRDDYFNFHINLRSF